MMVSSIEVGRMVSTNLYNRGAGVIYRVNGTPGLGPVQRVFGGVMVTGGTCNVDIAFLRGGRSQGLPESILCGVQWKLLDKVMSDEEVAAVVANALAYEASERAKESEAKAAFERAKGVAREAGKKLGLIPEAEFRASGKRGSAAAYNLRAELKRAGIKASVKQGGYTSIDVSLTNDNDKEAAKDIMLKYKAGNFDGMTDCYDYSPCAWGAVFGDVQYVFGRTVQGYSF